MKKNSAKDLTVEQEDKGRDSPEPTGKKSGRKWRIDLEVLKLPRKRER